MSIDGRCLSGWDAFTVLVNVTCNLQACSIAKAVSEAAHCACVYDGGGGELTCLTVSFPLDLPARHRAHFRTFQMSDDHSHI
jgi:hypothetical protein